MRFIAIHTTNADNEAGVLPSPEFMARMGQLTGGLASTGILVAGEGLKPSSTGVRLNFSGGSRTVTPGPFAGRNDLLAGFIIIRTESIDEAIEWATRFAGVVGDVEIDIRPVTEMWDLGLFPKPQGLTTTRYMLAHKATSQYEAGIAQAPEVKAGVEELIEEMKEADVFLSMESFAPSSQSVRLNFTGGKRTVIDGPFAESKELIAGFAIFQRDSIEEVMEFAPGFAELVGDVEIDIRPLYEHEHSESVS